MHSEGAPQKVTQIQAAQHWSRLPRNMVKILYKCQILALPLTPCPLTTGNVHCLLFPTPEHLSFSYPLPILLIPERPVFYKDCRINGVILSKTNKLVQWLCLRVPSPTQSLAVGECAEWLYVLTVQNAVCCILRDQTTSKNYCTHCTLVLESWGYKVMDYSCQILIKFQPSL